MKRCLALGIILVIILATTDISARALGDSSQSVGVKSGQWIKYTSSLYALGGEYTYTVYITLSVLSVDGTIVYGTINYDKRDGNPQTQPFEFDLTKKTDPPYLILANLTVGDHVCPYYSIDSLKIEGITVKSYLGSSRTVVWASLGFYNPLYSPDECHYIYYWDQNTGILVERVLIGADVIDYFIIYGTNAWSKSAFDFGNPLFWVLIATIVIIAIKVIRSFTQFLKEKHSSLDNESLSSAENLNLI